MDERKREKERSFERTEEMGRRERSVLNYFVLPGSFQARVLKFFKGKLVFLTFGELSIFETVGLNGWLRSIELQPCNTFGIACDMDPMIAFIYDR